MGAVTALMYGDKDPSIAGMVLDSPFSSLKILVEELVKDRVNLPNFIVNQALKLVKSTVSKKAKFKLDDIEPIKFAERCFIPSLFVAAKEDSFVKPHHAKLLHDVYPGDKNLISIEGDHNSVRPRFFKDSAAIFFFNTLQVEHIKEVSDNYAGFYSQTNYTDDNKINKCDNDKDLNALEIDDKLDNLLFNDNEFETEEEMFKKMIEMSKIEYEEELKKSEIKNNSQDKDKDKDKNDISLFENNNDLNIFKKNENTQDKPIDLIDFSDVNKQK